MSFNIGQRLYLSKDSIMRTSIPLENCAVSKNYQSKQAYLTTLQAIASVNEGNEQQRLSVRALGSMFLQQQRLTVRALGSMFLQQQRLTVRALISSACSCSNSASL